VEFLDIPVDGRLHFTELVACTSGEEQDGGAGGDKEKNRELHWEKSVRRASRREAREGIHSSG